MARCIYSVHRDRRLYFHRRIHYSNDIRRLMELKETQINKKIQHGHHPPAWPRVNNTMHAKNKIRKRIMDLNFEIQVYTRISENLRRNRSFLKKKLEWISVWLVSHLYNRVELFELTQVKLQLTVGSRILMKTLKSMTQGSLLDEIEYLRRQKPFFFLNFIRYFRSSNISLAIDIRW